MKIVRYAACAATVSLALVSGQVGAVVPVTSCWQADAATAASLHGFETMLMVGSLKCRPYDSAVAVHYQKLADSRAGAIDGWAQRVRSHFVAERGPQAGASAFEEYRTAIGNVHSSAPTDPKSCAVLAAYARLAGSADDAALLALAEAVDPLPPVRCRAETRRFATPQLAAPEPAVPVRAAVVATLDDGAAGDGSDAGPAVPAEPVVAVVPTVAEAKLAAPGAASALADAAKALAAAAAALEAERASPRP